jgi:hypothetical protein
MSEISRNKSKFKDAAALVTALQAVGYHPIVDLKNAQLLNDPYGRSQKKAHIIVRSKEVQSTYGTDLGFFVNADGTIEELQDFEGRSNFTDEKRRHVTAVYNETVLVKGFAARGLKPYKFTINAKGQKEIILGRA